MKKDTELYKFLLDLTKLFEKAKEPCDLEEGLRKTFDYFGEISFFKIYCFDEVSKTLKDFTKPWECPSGHDEIIGLNEYYKSFKYNTVSHIQEADKLIFPVIEEENLTGLIFVQGNFGEKSAFEIFPLVVKQISLAIFNLKCSENMRINSKFHKTIRQIAKIIESQYELNYILPILGEIIDGFISDHLIYVFLKQPKKKEFKLVWPAKCSILGIQEHLQKITIKSGSLIEEENKLGMFPLICENKVMGAIVAYNRFDELSQCDVQYLEELSKQAATTVERASSYMKILEHATLDALTGLNNRHQFQTRLSQEIATAKRQDASLCCIMTDIDFFKSVNDTYGHAVGDCVLKNVAKAILKELREYDIASRYGGEEFAILLPNTSMEEANLVAERLRKAIEKKKINIEDFKIKDKPTISVTISIGVSQYNKKMKEPSELYQLADKGLYVAKENGRNQVVISEI